MLWLSYLSLLGIPVNYANGDLKQIVRENIFNNEIWTMQKIWQSITFKSIHFSLILPGLPLSALIIQ